MQLSPEEQSLLAGYRRLGNGDRKELADFLRFLLSRREIAQPDAGSGDRCTLEKEEKRPEAAKEPLFTE